ncbi:chorismate-binding protein [Nocardioides humi]|uniref:chorismate-binding protein n=1 Tax=Nocardioides humi TaxID=449461 RepID=UPI0015E83D7B
MRTAPIKGTASIASDPADLESSRKERAENVMIVDLMRNDLGRICAPGTVEVEDVAEVRAQAGVWHLVSRIRGEIADGVDDRAIIEATFPPGSVTGAPKIRAMEVIGSVETAAREVYTGAIGWSGPTGMEFNVAIRTFEFGAGRAVLGVGAGIVADSVPDGEVDECLVKAAPLLDAVGARLAPDAQRAFAGLRSSAGPAPVGSRTVGAPRLLDDVGDRGEGRIHVLDEHVVVDWGRRPPSGGVRIVDLLRRSGLPVEIRPLAAGERSRVSEEFGFELLGRSAVPEVRSRLAAAGPLQRWLEDAVARAAPTDPPPHRGVAGRTSRILLVDNYDSFVFNVAQCLLELGALVEVVRNDRLDVDALARSTGERWDGVVVSPGPGDPSDAGACVELIRRLPPALPLLGVCLGHQAIGAAFGARIVRAPRPAHGCRSLVHHDGSGVFAGTDGPILAGRYHSLVIDEGSLVGTALEVTARTPSGLVMGVRHRDRPIEGIQFHPESILTPRGRDLLGAFLDRVRAAPTGTRSARSAAPEGGALVHGDVQ